VGKTVIKRLSSKRDQQANKPDAGVDMD